MGIGFGREVCGVFETAAAREWLVTNGIGGYAAGTVAGVLTRRYHGLLVAALHPPLGRTLMLTKLDELAVYDDRPHPLFTNRWSDGTLEPQGFELIEHFSLEGTIPVWRFALADALLEKRIWMQAGENTTYVRYSLSRDSRPLKLRLKALVNYRDYHSITVAKEWQMATAPVAAGIQITAFDTAVPLYLLSQPLLSHRANCEPAHEWYCDFNLSVERYRGLSDREDHLHAATFTACLNPGESFTLVASTNPTPNLEGETALQRRQEYENQLIQTWKPQAESPAWLQPLVLAADQFIVARPSPADPDGKTILAGYPWFSDWGRDTMISLPGLTLATGRPEIARSILQTFAQYVDRGMLPNRFPDAGETPEYNTLDASLWYFEAIRAYEAVTGDGQLLQELYPVLVDMIDWHCRGTRYNIHLDPADGLLYGGEVGTQLTWMDAKVGDWVVTPRMGKPIEINALWYNALRTMTTFARKLGKPYQMYEAMGDRTQASFSRFWNSDLGYCYDVLDTPAGNDASLRPNQIFAVALPESPLSPVQQQAVVDVCARKLLTSYGLRSLGPDQPGYQGHYGGDQRQRDGAYHQGTVWGWLLGPFVMAHLRVYQNPALAQQFLEPMADHLNAHGVGSLSEIFDGDPPFTPRGCFAQAWTVAEILRAWTAIQSCSLFNPQASINPCE
uniref:Glycogen debranching enzyme n=1 Tax=Cyanothece sp. (strain PCC 7425 / ATCC 29141) TaxID=395961 RepID=B8HYG4_CYAP4